MTDTDFDLFVIGGGSGGVRAARMAASMGVRTGLCESSDMGGTCVNLGCVPKKLFAYSSAFSAHFKDAAGFGWTRPEARFHWRQLVENKNKEIKRLNSIYSNLLTNSGVQVFLGHGHLEGPHTVRVGDQTLTATRILIATGSTPAMLQIPGNEHCLVSDTLFHLPHLPKRMVVVGGGYIGIEFASIFQGLGCKVHVLHRGPRILKHFDTETVLHLQNELQKRGIVLHLNETVREITKGPEGLEVIGSSVRVPTDHVLMAVGRNPNSKSLNLESAGIRLQSNGAIPVNEYLQTSTPSIYAVGDVIDRAQLTPVALEEGMQLVRHLYGKNSTLPFSYTQIPTAVFTKPELASVGMTEAEAADKITDVSVYASEFRAMKHTLSGNTQRAFMKLVVDEQTDIVLGCHMVGEGASEIIQGLAIALQAGATKEHFDRTFGIHPTAAEEFVTMRTPRPKSEH